MEVNAVGILRIHNRTIALAQLPLTYHSHRMYHWSGAFQGIPMSLYDAEKWQIAGIRLNIKFDALHAIVTGETSEQ